MSTHKHALLEAEVERAIERSLLPAMRASAWRHRGARLFYMDNLSPARLCEVEVEPAKKGLRVGLRFGVWFAKVARLAEALHDRGLPHAQDCTAQVNLEQLVAENEQGWVALRGPDDVPAVAEHLTWGWRTYGKLWIERHCDLEAALDHLLEQGDNFPAVAVCVVLGRKGQALDLLTQEVFAHPLHAAQLRDWGRRHDLL